MLKKLVKIEQLLDEAQGLYGELSKKEQTYFSKKHDKEKTLEYCLEWGNKAVEEMLDDVLQMLSDGESIQYGWHRMKYDKEFSEYIVDQYESTIIEGERETITYIFVGRFESFSEALDAIQELK